VRCGPGVIIDHQGRSPALDSGCAPYCLNIFFMYFDSTCRHVCCMRLLLRLDCRYVQVLALYIYCSLEKLLYLLLSWDFGPIRSNVNAFLSLKTYWVHKFMWSLHHIYFFNERITLKFHYSNHSFCCFSDIFEPMFIFTAINLPNACNF
jgi:hypothetical protein